MKRKAKPARLAYKQAIVILIPKDGNWSWRKTGYTTGRNLERAGIRRASQERAKELIFTLRLMTGLRLPARALEPGFAIFEDHNPTEAEIEWLNSGYAPVYLRDRR